MRISLAVTVAPGTDLIGVLERSQREVTVLRRAADLAELIAAARSGMVDAVLVAGGSDELTRAFLDELEAAPRPVGIVALSDIRSERVRLRGLGVPCLRADAAPLELARAIQDAARAAALGVQPTAGLAEEEPDGVEALVDSVDAVPGTVEVDTGSLPVGVDPTARWDLAGQPVPDSAFSEVWGGPAPDIGEGAATTDGGAAPTVLTEDVGDDAPKAATDDGGPGDGASGRGPSRVVVVWGPTGAPGRTTVAVNVAAELALTGLATLLVDLDTYGPAVGAHLGLADETAGVSRAARRADRERITAADLVEAAVRVRVACAEMDVLTGLSRPDRWPEVRGSAVERILAAAREHWDRVVVDVGFSLEEDEELSFDVPAPQRNAATLAALGAADRVLAVGTADAVGLPRLIRGVEALGRAVTAEGVGVVVNRTRAGASGVSPRAQVSSVWARYGPPVPVAAFLPWDPGAADRALLGGQVLAEAAPSSPLRRAVASLARREGAVPPGDGRRRRRATRSGTEDDAAAGRRGSGRRLVPWSALSRRTP